MVERQAKTLLFRYNLALLRGTKALFKEHWVYELDMMLSEQKRRSVLSDGSAEVVPFLLQCLVFGLYLQCKN